MVTAHHKRTISMADVLYGVAMQEQGVSEIVSFKFHKAGRKVIDHTLASIETAIEGPRVEDEEDEEQAKQETLEVVMAMQLPGGAFLRLRPSTPMLSLET